MKKKLKILYIIDTLNTGGAEKSLVEIAVNNNEVNSIFITLYDFEEKTLLNNLKRNNIPVFSINCQKKFGFSNIKKKLLPLIQELNPDIIHTTLLRSDLVTRSLKKDVDVPLIGSFVSNSYSKEKYNNLSYSNKLKHYALELYNKFTTNKVDFFISNSLSIKKANAEVLKIPLNKIKVIYRGRHPDIFENVSQKEIDRFIEEFQLQSSHTIVSVGRLRKSKGFDDLIHAFSQISPLFSDWKLIIVGEGPYRNHLQKLIRQYNLNNQIILTGNRNEIPAILKATDLFVLPSHLEGLPGALIEAMFAQKLILCSDIPENKECVTENEAVFFSKGNIQDLKKQMQNILNNYNLYINLGYKARMLAYKKFDLKNIVKQYNATYIEVVKTFNK